MNRLFILVLIWVTFGYVISNFLLAFSGLNPILILLLRDGWIILFTLVLFEKSKVVFIILILTAIFGLVPIFWTNNGYLAITYFYGLRDLYLFGFVFYTMQVGIYFRKFNLIIVFFRFVLLMALLQIAFDFADMSLSSILRTEDYFMKKGVSSELGFGFFGDRLSVPFYSPNILGNSLVSFYFFSDKSFLFNRFEKILVMGIVLLTLSKILLLFIFVRTFKRRAIFVALVSIIALIIFLPSMINLIDNPLLTYHMNSVAGHLISFNTFNNFIFTSDFLNLLGSNSTYVLNLTNTHTGEIIESTLLSRLLDLKVFMIPFVVLFVVWLKRFEREDSFFTFFILTMLTTATSNQPVCWIRLTEIKKKH